MTDVLTEKLNELLAQYLPSQAAYTYWSNPRGDEFFYTKERVRHRGKARYVAGIYRFLKTKSTKKQHAFKLVRKAGFATKKQAIDRAWRWFEEDRGKRGGHPLICWICGGVAGYYHVLIGDRPGTQPRRICLSCQRRGNHPTGIKALTVGPGYSKTREVEL